jgi:hypothetical protein
MSSPAELLEELVLSTLRGLGVPEKDLTQEYRRLKGRSRHGNLSRRETITIQHEGRDFHVRLPLMRAYLARVLDENPQRTGVKPTTKEIASALGYLSHSSVVGVLKSERPDLYKERVERQKSEDDSIEGLTKSKEEDEIIKSVGEALMNTGIPRAEVVRVYDHFMRHIGGSGRNSHSIKINGEDRPTEELRAAAAHWMYVYGNGGEVDDLQVSHVFNYANPTKAMAAIEQHNERLNRRLGDKVRN